jgi:hypothetical protein
MRSCNLFNDSMLRCRFVSDRRAVICGVTRKSEDGIVGY